MDGIVNNQVDAAFSSTISGNAYKIASSPRGIRYPTFPHDDKAGWARMHKIAPFFVPAFGTEGADLSKDNKAEAATYPYPVLMTMKATETDLVYNMTKAMVELFDDYKDGAPGNTGWDIKRQIFAWAIPMHEGAVRYLQGARRVDRAAPDAQRRADQAAGRAGRGLEGLQRQSAVRRRRIRQRLDEGARRGARARPGSTWWRRPGDEGARRGLDAEVAAVLEPALRKTSASWRSSSLSPALKRGVVHLERSSRRASFRAVGVVAREREPHQAARRLARHRRRP